MLRRLLVLAHLHGICGLGSSLRVDLCLSGLRSTLFADGFSMLLLLHSRSWRLA